MISPSFITIRQCWWQFWGNFSDQRKVNQNYFNEENKLLIIFCKDTLWSRTMTPRNELLRRKLKTSSKPSRQAQTKKNFHYQATLWIFQVHLQVLQKVSQIWTQSARHFNEKRYHLAVGQKLSPPQLCKDAAISPQTLRKVLSWCYSMGLIICLPKISWIT